MKAEMDPALIVFNERAGNPLTVQKITMALKQQWPPGTIDVESFDKILADTALLKDKNIIGIGGDGTHGTLARANREINPDHWYLALQAGTVGFVSRSLGLSSRFRETPVTYAKRIKYLLMSGRLRELDIAPGVVGTNEQVFLFAAGLGDPSIAAFSAIEKRRATSGKLQRIFLAARAFRAVSATSPPIKITVGNNSFEAIDAMVVKQPFNLSNQLSVPFSAQDALLAVVSAKNQSAFGGRLLIDLVRLMIFHQMPIAGGIIIQPILPNETVVFSYLPAGKYHFPLSFHLDSELEHTTQSSIPVIASETSIPGKFRMLAK